MSEAPRFKRRIISAVIASDAKRFCHQIKTDEVFGTHKECLCKVILFGERSLRRALKEYVEHYHAERNHQGKGNVLLFPRDRNVHRRLPVQCYERLGGPLRYYHREAA